MVWTLLLGEMEVFFSVTFETDNACLFKSQSYHIFAPSKCSAQLVN